MIVAGCGGTASTLDPAGPSAAAVAELWWVMLGGAVVILTGVFGAALYAFVPHRRLRSVPPRAFLIGGGLAFPAITLMILLVFALTRGEWLLAAQRPDALRVEVVARQWQWEFRYPDVAGAPARTFDRLHVPAGQWVEVHVTSADVIHSFWVPRLGGKIDAIPGHINVIRLRADAPGEYRGLCSEFCGVGHAVMGFVVEAHPAADYAAALRRLQSGDPQ